MEKSPVLSLRNASIVQGSHRVLTDVNLEVAAGEFIYVIGATGSGKSSLLKTLYADLPLESGEGRIVGYDLRNLQERDIPYLRRQLGIVFQDFQLLMDRSVRDNLDFVLRATGQMNRNENDDRIDNVRRRVGMPTKGHNMPHQLSGGEQQRVSIARTSRWPQGPWCEPVQSTRRPNCRALGQSGRGLPQKGLRVAGP